jgi:hypothetical protein
VTAGDQRLRLTRRPTTAAAERSWRSRQCPEQRQPGPAPACDQHLGETLELPGEPTDYHFAIQSVLEALWKRRRTEPTVLTTVEQLAWLDLSLAQARPDAVSTDIQGKRKFYAVLAFQYLITLYEREGALREALEVAELAVRYQQQQAKRDELVGRVTALDTEEAG